MPFGLSNAPSTFQATMNDVFRPVLRQYVLIFFDDILIYNATPELHYSHLQHVLETLAHHQFYAKYSKCIFGVPHIDYLGHIISIMGVAADLTKLHVIQQWPKPNTLTALRGFLGLAGYCRRFVRYYSQIAPLLTDILKQQQFCWSTNAQQAFDNL